MPKSFSQKYTWQYCIAEIIKHINLSVGSTKGMTFGEYCSDTNAKHLTRYHSIIVGENINRLSREFRGNHPDIPWRQIVAHRNELVHEYEDVTAKDVWRVVQQGSIIKSCG